jgi:AbrB family looped-hinge helix DNA binding protein
MNAVRVSDKGQVTLPAAVRRQLGITSKSRMEVEVRDNTVVLKPVGDLMDAFGALSEYAKGDAQDWDNVRGRTERAVAEEVENESKR